jgi:hypothetical protein
MAHARACRGSRPKLLHPARGRSIVRAKACDISQGGIKVETAQPPFARNAEVVVSLPGLPPQPGRGALDRRRLRRDHLQPAAAAAAADRVAEGPKRLAKRRLSDSRAAQICVRSAPQSPGRSGATGTPHSSQSCRSRWTAAATQGRGGGSPGSTRGRGVGTWRSRASGVSGVVELDAGPLVADPHDLAGDHQVALAEADLGAFHRKPSPSISAPSATDCAASRPAPGPTSRQRRSGERWSGADADSVPGCFRPCPGTNRRR